MKKSLKKKSDYLFRIFSFTDKIIRGGENRAFDQEEFQGREVLFL